MSVKRISVKAINKAVGKLRLDTGEVVDYFYPALGEVEIETTFVQQYLNVVGVLLKLTPCAKDLVAYLTLLMDKDNLVDFHKRNKDDFIDLCVTKEDNARYKLRSVDNALQELKSKNIIREIKRAYFLVNPLYYFKDDADKRFDMIRLQIDFERGKKTKKKTTNQ